MFTPSKEHIRQALLYDFHRGRKATAAAQHIQCA